MRLHLRISVFLIALLAMVSHARAQQVNTLYFLENAPMRHTINPAFQPVSKFYLTFPVIGYTSLWVGNNSLSMSDIIFKDANGQTITALHPNAQGQLWDKLPNTIDINTDLRIELFSLGWRIREKGYAHLNISERLTVGAGIPKSLFGPLLQQESSTWSLNSLNASVALYTDIALGYSHRINEQWTVGGRLKFLLGHTYLSGGFDKLQFDATTDNSTLTGTGSLRQAGIAQAIIQQQELDIYSISSILNYLIPAGFGGAIDLGMTYKPIKNLQITAAITDMGMIRWKKASISTLSIDTTFAGFGDFVYEDYVHNGEFQMDSLSTDILNNLKQYGSALHANHTENTAFNQMLYANLNIGVDANFWKNRIGIGIYSRTQFKNNHISEEITLGAALRPANWFQLAASYSFLNGKWSNVGAAISLAPYDGLMFTLAADYIPLSYAQYTPSEDIVIPLPYKTRGVNLAFGIAIVAGTNPNKKKIDKDKDGVADYLDKCLDTPSNVSVDADGCPMDSDGDGIADYIDECTNTPSQAYGQIDSVGCPIDSDLDGVADYIDECPNTPAAAHNLINAHGCPIDTDGDGVFDYEDQCPDTPQEAHNMVDQYGCPLDSDHDGITDYKDLCPNTIVEARTHVNEQGCPIDTDGDGVFDYEDQCPTITGKKSTSGCPELKQQVRSLLNRATKEIHFENGKATIKESSDGILDEVAKVFINNPTYIIEIQGHTDNVGNYQHNIDLSEKQAKVVREYLIQHGVPAERMMVRGYGPDRPITTNDTKEGRTLNRRVEFKITFEETTDIEHN